MTRQEELGKEVEALKEKAFGDKGKAVVEESKGTVETNQSPKEDLTESTEVIAQEDISLEQQKPTRTKWKEEYLKEKARADEADKRFRNYKSSTDGSQFQLRQDVAKAHREIESLSEENVALNTKLSEVKIKDVGLSLDQEVIDELGSDAIEAFDKISQARLDAAIGPLQKELEREKRRRIEESKVIAETSEEQAHSNFISRLKGVVPDYREMDIDPVFLNWMEELDAFSGVPKKTLFLQAKAVGDVGRVAQFFTDFKKLKYGGRNTLEEQVSPQTSASNTQRKMTNKPKVRYISLKKIEEFQRNLMKGQYKDKPKLVEEMRAVIQKAQRERRIVP